MGRNLSIINEETVPTLDELYSTAALVEDAATVAGILVGVSMSEKDMSSVMNFFSSSLSMAAAVLTEGLDPCGGTFSKGRKQYDPPAA